MKIISDLHIHSKYSRATSKQLDVPNLVRYARMKGVGLLGTGDLTHAEWIKELRGQLTEDGSGILRDPSGFPFILTGEISSIYTDGGKVRRIHNIITAPSFEVAEQINDALTRRGVNLRSDGRPICGLSSPDIVETLKGVDQSVQVIPAHIWTPWFSLFGSMSGFDTVEECFKDQSKHIRALETGLSSDPAMNWRLSGLDKYSLISNSDSHSFWPWRIGREANVFEMDKLDYDGYFKVMYEKDPSRFLMTIEVDPSYGKYHFDGHRSCNVCMKPSESIKNRKLCPVCGRQMTIGVLHRVEELSDRAEGFVPKGAIPFKSLIPLSEVIASFRGVSQPFSKKVWTDYDRLLKEFGSEFSVLMDAPRERIASVIDERIAKAIIDIREGRVEITPGYDGVYGRPVFHDNVGEKAAPAPTQAPRQPLNRQKSISEFSG